MLISFCGWNAFVSIFYHVAWWLEQVNFFPLSILPSPFYTIHETSLNCAFQKHTNSKVQKSTWLSSNHLSGPLYFNGFKRSWFSCDLWLVDFGPFCVFHGSTFTIVIIIDGSEKRNCEGSFWTLEFVCEKHSSTVHIFNGIFLWL